MTGSGKPGTPKRPASLQMIADHLGLSAAAVSRVLNDAPAARSIPKATQERILAAAREFNYRPNVLARSLRRGHSMTIGVLLPEVSEGYATLVLAGVEQALLEAGYVFYLVSHHHQPERVKQAQTMFVERFVDGILAIDTVLERHTELPTVTVSCPDGHEGMTNIVLNQRRGAELALEHLAGLGHREVAFIRGQPFSSDSGPRWRAVEEAAGRSGIALHPALVAQLEGDLPTHEPGYLAAQRLLASGEPFTALFAFNDVSAIGAVRALVEAGLRVPQDVSVVGFDDVQSAAFQNPALTTVRQPLKTMGRLAAETLVRRIATPVEHPPARQLVIDPELVVRESTGPVAKARRG